MEGTPLVGDAPTKKKRKGPSVPVIVGTAIGIIVLVVVAALLITFNDRNKKKDRNDSSNLPDDPFERALALQVSLSFFFSLFLSFSQTERN
jgi:flagellar basal body-associated protein FliL